MDIDLKDKIITIIRKKHHIALDSKDPIFAIITANDIILEEQLKQLNNIFKLQLIDMEQVTKNHLENAKELLEKKLTLALHESKKAIKETQTQNLIQEEKNNLSHPLVTLVIGFILGYGLSLFLL